MSIRPFLWWYCSRTSPTPGANHISFLPYEESVTYLPIRSWEEARKYTTGRPPDLWEGWVEKMSSLGIDRAVVFGVLVDNDFIAEMVQKYAPYLIGFAYIYPTEGDAAIEELERCVKNLGLKGVKLITFYQAIPFDSSLGGKEPDEFVIWALGYLKEKGFKGAVVLDVGCGEGRHCIYLAKEGYIAHGIEIASVAVKKGRRWVEEEGLQGKVVLVVGNSPELPYRLGAFDMVLDFHTLEFVHRDERKRHVGEIARVLRPGGLFCIRAGKPPSKSHFIKVEDLERWLKESFEVVYWDAPADKDRIEAMAQRIYNVTFDHVTLSPSATLRINSAKGLHCAR